MNGRGGGRGRLRDAIPAALALIEEVPSIGGTEHYACFSPMRMRRASSILASGAHHALIPGSIGAKSVEFFCPRINLLSSSLSSGLSLSSCPIYYDFNLGQEKRIKKWLGRRKEGEKPNYVMRRRAALFAPEWI